MDKPILTYVKKAEAVTNKIRIPKKIIEQYGSYYNLELYADGTMRLIPIRKEK